MEKKHPVYLSGQKDWRTKQKGKEGGGSRGWVCGHEFGCGCLCLSIMCVNTAGTVSNVCIERLAHLVLLYIYLCTQMCLYVHIRVLVHVSNYHAGVKEYSKHEYVCVWVCVGGCSMSLQPLEYVQLNKPIVL